MNSTPVIVSGSFDSLCSRDLRFLQEAARLGPVNVMLWTDEVIGQHTGKPPRFPFAERSYFLNGVRYVTRVTPFASLPGLRQLTAETAGHGGVWVDRQPDSTAERRDWCRAAGLDYRVLEAEALSGFPEEPVSPPTNGPKKVVVTGCYDWFHSGHVRFFEEASRYGELYVIIGHDANIRLLKGEGHPLLPQAERRYMAASIRFVKAALVSSGSGWLDADPEIRLLKPDIYAVNEDGDRGGKREYCQERGIQYLVLQRRPAPGLPARTSTALRGF